MGWWSFLKVTKPNKDDSGTLAKHKLWLVVKGFEQKRRLDFDEIFL